MLRLLTVDHALPVALVDTGGHVLAVEGTTREAIDAPAVAAALAGPRRAEVAFTDGTVASLFRVGTLAEGDAALLCLRALVDLTAAERDALEQTARFLTVELARRHALHAIESRFAGELLEMLYDAARRGTSCRGDCARSGSTPPGRWRCSRSRSPTATPTAPGLADVDRPAARALGRPGGRPAGLHDAVAILGWRARRPTSSVRRASRRRARPRVAGPARGRGNRPARDGRAASCAAACSRRARRGGWRSAGGAGRR